ncbi:MAG TPA: LLM class flavin-dependent oxidoreductase, partial [Caldilineaceae bacterium]|nr:LLM class flavin-dependent oxidoreductase [Caldilineaceae bacterium]
PPVPAVMGENLDECRAAVKPQLALYVGGMGARGKNFYYDLVCRYGYADAAERIQQLYLAGQKGAAATAVPDELVDDVALCGSPLRIKEQFTRWRDSPVTTLNLMQPTLESVRLMADLVQV